jgi:hypothetical protein
MSIDFKEIMGESGFSQFKLTREDFRTIHDSVYNHWLGLIEVHFPQYVDAFAKGGLKKYHQNAHLINHGSFWSKQMRVLPSQVAEKIKSLSFFRQLESNLGKIEITSEENTGHEEFYWRLCRPVSPEDFGPLHADHWFWELNQWSIPEGKERIKVWVAVETEPGKNGLRLVPGSHKKKWEYNKVFKHGINKPDFDESAVEPLLIETKPGDAIGFNYHLLHGGALNSGENTRVSMEFTMLVDKKRL